VVTAGFGCKRSPTRKAFVMSAGSPQQPSTRVELASLVNEFAAVRITLDTAGHDSRLVISDIESGDEIVLSPIELASLCQATPEDRVNWLRVGSYRDEPARRGTSR
jgi:hypothetical protein